VLKLNLVVPVFLLLLLQPVSAQKMKAAPARKSAAAPASPLIAQLRRKIKYVFVIYQENRSFDSYFGTFPGADGLFTRSPRQTPGFYQELIDTDGKVTTIHPFRIGPKEFAADTDDIDHSHMRIVAKMNVQHGIAHMDKFAVTEELKYSPTGNPSLLAKQFGELAMAYEDCDTIPLLWSYAHKFVLFDHIFEQMTGPSTPGNLAIIGAQSGETQWALHPDEGYPGHGNSEAGVPVTNDRDPFWGSAKDPNAKADQMPARNNKGTSSPQYNLTYATIPLTLAGDGLSEIVKTDRDPEKDLRDVHHDVDFISNEKKARIAFAWYEEGFDKEPTDDDDDDGPVDAGGTHASYITHHNGPQYFGYISNNPQMSNQLHGLQDFFTALDARSLPPQGGAFFLKGGLKNLLHLVPGNPDPSVQKNFLGDDDHPAYSDAQISEALVAEVINKVAASPYWPESAIIVTWDDSEGDYDHVPPPIRSFGPDHSLLTNGPRVPLLVISPYSRTHAVVHAQGSHSSVVKFIDTVFNLTPLAKLPDEVRGRELGKKEFGQDNLGPEDALTSGITDLLGAFSPGRLAGRIAPLPPAYAQFPESIILNLPQTTGFGCKEIGIVPTDYKKGIPNEVPIDFNPRPKTNPTH
jgi:phospholipase C